MEGKEFTLDLYVCMLAWLFTFYRSEQDLYDAGQDTIRALEGQLAALQVVDEDDVEDTEETEDAAGEEDTTDEGGDDDGDDGNGDDADDADDEE